MDDTDRQCPEAYCETLFETLHYAASKSMPRPKPRTRRQVWDGDVSRAMAANKVALAAWRDGDRPNMGILYQERKITKRILRQALRQANAKSRVKIYEDIAESAHMDPKLFHRLIRSQKSSTSTAGLELRVDGLLVTESSDVLAAWSEHFKHLATPQDNPGFDVPQKRFIDEDILVMLWIAGSCTADPEPILHSEVSRALKSLNNGKAQDIHGIRAEHIKAADIELIPYLTDLFNTLLSVDRPVAPLNEAYILPIHKKGKDPLSRDNYRGITITPVLSKLMEHVILSRISYNQLQSPLQYGFTKGLSPTMAVLVVTEAISDAVDRHAPLYIAALDVKKAFDVVHHPSLLHKLFHQSSVCNSTWNYIKNNNLNTEARVKLQGTLGDPFTVNQGVGQGKILSTFNYKLYINDLLCQLSRSDFGSHVGTDYLGAPTCADDVILLADNIVDLQSQLNVVEDYASRERYIIHPDKSKLITYGTCNPSTASLNGKDITPDNMLIHLGIERHANVQHSEAFFDARISLARRTSYSLMGTGFHGNNGISPAFTIPIYRTYVIPRLMYGLEAITIKDKHLSKLDRYHRNTLRELQTLPTRTAKCAIHLLAGTPPPLRMSSGPTDSVTAMQRLKPS